MRFYFLITILAGSLGSFVAKAQETRNYSNQNSSYQQSNKEHVDQKGNKYYIDSEGYPYYIDQSGNPYYIDKNGDVYYADKNGNFYYLDSKGNPYYIDNKGEPYYLDKNGQPYYPNQQKESYFPKQQTKNYNDNIYPETPRSKYRTARAELDNQQKPIEPDYTLTDSDRFRLAVGGGYSYRLGDTQGISGLRNAFNLDMDIQGFFKDRNGIGLTLNYVKLNTSYDYEQSLFYVGPSYVFKESLAKNFSFVYNIGLGPLFFNEKSSYESYSKTAFALNTGIAGEYEINSCVAIGAKLSATLGYFEDSYSGQKTTVSSISLTGFISFRSK